MTKIAISYRRDDSMDITGRIFDRLTSRYGRNSVFRDIDSIPPGLDFREHLRKSLDDSDVLMVVVGPHWMGVDRHGQPRIQSETDYVRTEVEMALNRHIPVIPLLVGGAEMPEPSELPESVRNFAYRNAVEIDSGRDFDHHMTGLIRATDKILHSEPPRPSGAVESPEKSEAQRATPQQSNLFFPIVGGVMLAQGVIHVAWFSTYAIPGFLGTDNLQRLFQNIWVYADMIYGFGGLIVGLGTIYGRAWARISGITLCLLGVFGNFLWFVQFFDKPVERLVLVATGFGLLLAVIGSYFYAFRWPTPANK
jgi:TIR domain